MTESITQLEQRYRNFYAPAFELLVDNKDIVKEMFMEVASVQVDNTLKGADRFSFTVNSTFNFEKRDFEHLTDLFGFGKPVVISLGYQDKASMKLMHSGIITAVQTSFPAGGLPQINVSGYDNSFAMTKGKEPDSWPNSKDSDVVLNLADRYGLKAVVKDTLIKHPMIKKEGQSDFEFIEKLAERNGYEFYVFDSELFFRPPENEKAAVVSLEWGKGLISFAPEINISEQVSDVEVRGWDVNTKKEIVGKAKRGDERGRDAKGQSGGEIVATVFPDKSELKVRMPVFSQQEADRRALAILKKRAELFVQGSGESIGLPDILADKNIELLGLGKLFSKTYYIEQSTHTLSSSGYKTTFKVKDVTK